MDSQNSPKPAEVETLSNINRNKTEASEYVCYACGLPSFTKSGKRHTIVACSSENCETYNASLLPNFAHLPACGGQPGWKPAQDWYCSARCYLDKLNAQENAAPLAFNHPQHIYLATVNCHGLLANRYQIWKSLHTENYDVLMMNVTEKMDSKLTKYMPETVDADFYLRFPKYDLIWNDAQRKGHGVAIYIRVGAVQTTRIESIRLPHKGIFGVDPKETDVAANFIGLRTVDTAPWNGATLISAFRPPRDERRFQNAFVQRLSSFLEADPTRTIVAGDMNFDCPLWRLTIPAQQIVRGPTRQLAGASNFQTEQFENPVEHVQPKSVKNEPFSWKHSLKRNQTLPPDISKSAGATKNKSVSSLISKLIRRPYRKSFGAKRAQSTHDVNKTDTQSQGPLDNISQDLTIDVPHDLSVSPTISPQQPNGPLKTEAQDPINGPKSPTTPQSSNQWVGNTEGACLDLILLTDKVRWIKCGLGLSLQDKHCKTRSRLVWSQLEITPQ